MASCTPQHRLPWADNSRPQVMANRAEEQSSDGIPRCASLIVTRRSVRPGDECSSEARRTRHSDEAGVHDPTIRGRFSGVTRHERLTALGVGPCPYQGRYLMRCYSTKELADKGVGTVIFSRLGRDDEITERHRIDGALPTGRIRTGVRHIRGRRRDGSRSRCDKMPVRHWRRRVHPRAQAGWRRLSSDVI